ncbi:hypothetical protein C8046_16650 [Serinibacter arcticus]|uniref:ANTAR domain-containing protein n=1 Tax=Serinibacter arcticus TaxID=1655435 RepID=A0A2U1ZYG9_9MICO|nr:hypothetical protein C8046_16650 [Serinibacter arcticus]
MNDLPAHERKRILAGLATTLAALPLDQPQPWRLGEALRLMVGADGVALTVDYLTDGRTTICASDELANTLESLQEVAGEGPGYQAARLEAFVLVDLASEAEKRWPRLAQALHKQRIRQVSLCAVPLHLDGLRGVATVYTGLGEPLAERPDQVAFLANALGPALLEDAARQPEGRPHASSTWGSRTVVHHATGMVMAQADLASQDALALLRARAYVADARVDQVAASVVSGELDFSNGRD